MCSWHLTYGYSSSHECTNLWNTSEYLCFQLVNKPADKISTVPSLRSVDTTSYHILLNAIPESPYQQQPIPQLHCQSWPPDEASPCNLSPPPTQKKRRQRCRQGIHARGYYFYLDNLLAQSLPNLLHFHYDSVSHLNSTSARDALLPATGANSWRSPM